jgi:putative transposase
VEAASTGPGANPAGLYQPSPRPYRGLGELHYPFNDRTVTVTHCGRICVGKRRINLSQVFAGQRVGIKQVSDQIWLFTFIHYDLGYFDKRDMPAPTNR